MHKSPSNEHELADIDNTGGTLTAFIRLNSTISIFNPTILNVNLLASKLDIDLSADKNSNECRFAFYGVVLNAGQQTEYSEYRLLDRKNW